MSGIVAQGYDEIADRFAEWAAATPDTRPRWAHLDLPSGADVLELGCGAGLGETRALAERYRVTALDISSEQLRRARRNAPGATFLHADLTAVEFDPESFDAVLALFCLNHVPRRMHAGVFARVADWLRPGGLFLATLSALEVPDRTGEWLGTTMFFSGFDAVTNARLLVDAGFTIVEDEVVAVHEPEGDVPFQWVLARR